MDAYEATKVVMSRIQSLDPENVSKIMGYILIQDQGEKEMIRLALGPETLLLPYINQAKACLGLLGSNSPSSNPSTPIANPLRPTNSFPPRVVIPNNGLHLSNPSSPGGAAGFQRNGPRPFSYAAALNGSAAAGDNAASPSQSLNFYSGNDFGVQYQLPFLDDSAADPIMSPSGRSDSLVFHYGEDMNSPHSHPFHRSCSVNDAALLSNLEEGGNGGAFGWRPCMYFARGHCKNGASCKFLHGGNIGGGAGDTIEVGSPSKNSTGFEELLRMKALQQQRLARMGHHPFPFTKCMDFLSENPRASPANGFRNYNFQRPERGDFTPVGLAGGGNSSSRQIYLTFPTDSTFKEEDVSDYFNTFGPVQDVRIPYQQKRMFGFVTFHYPETVKLILAKGNPHFVCDSRVLVKPYKEKGKIQEKKQQQQYHLERAEHPSCLSPTGDIDLTFGSRLTLGTQEMMIRRKLEQEAELQHAIELQGRRMMNFQLMDLKNQQHLYPLIPSLRPGATVSSPRESQLLLNQNFTTESDVNNQETSTGSQEAANTLVLADNQKLELKITESPDDNFFTGINKLHVNGDDSDFPESFEHILPENLFASPTKSAAENQPNAFSQASVIADDAKYVTSTSSNSNPCYATWRSSSPCHGFSRVMLCSNAKPLKCRF